MTESTNLLSDLQALLGEGGVLTGDAVTSRAAGVFRKDGIQARAIVRPRSTAEVAAVLRLCNAAGQPVVTHGGRTGLVHGGDTQPADIVLSLERMTRIEAVDTAGRTATVEAGVVLESLQEAAQAAGLYYPVDFGARGSATVGGSIATNAGGNRVIRYGMTRASVLGLEAVLANGTVLSSMNAMVKNNAGYDLKQLFIGSEGTLGVVTRAVLRLHEQAQSQCTALVACPDFAALQGLLKHMDRGLGGQLAAFEVMWQSYFDLVSQPPAPGRSPFTERYPFYALVESMGADEASDQARFMAALEGAMEAGLAVDATVAQSLEQRDALWRLRDSVEEMFKHPGLHAFDVSLPASAMEAYAQAVQAQAQARWPNGHCWIFGHMGDGNLHVTITTGSVPTDAATTHAVEAVVYEPLRPLRGAVSAEHGIGLEKKAWLDVSRTAEEIGLMRQLKGWMDPRSILNPGKIV